MILSLTIFFPLLGALLVGLLPKGTPAKTAALIVTVIEFVISLGILGGFDSTTAAMQMAEAYPWIPSIGVSYFVAVDGISLTVARLHESHAGFQIVPHTLAHTTLGSLRPGDAVNVECDIIGKYVVKAVHQAR